MFWYGPGPLFLISVMTLDDVEGFRGLSSVRAGLFQVVGASVKIMNTQSLMLPCCVKWSSSPMGGPDEFSGASEHDAVGFGAPPSRPECSMTSQCLPASALVDQPGFRYPGMPVTSEWLGIEDTITIGTKVRSPRPRRTNLGSS